MFLEYYTAPWCGPCKIFGPIIGRVTEKLNIPMEKINIDENPERAPKDMLGIPTVIMYEDEKEVARITGARSEGDLIEWLS